MILCRAFFVHNFISDCVLDLQEVPNGLNQLACEFQGLVPGEEVEIAGHVLVFIAHLGNSRLSDQRYSICIEFSET